MRDPSRVEPFNNDGEERADNQEHCEPEEHLLNSSSRLRHWQEVCQHCEEHDHSEQQSRNVSDSLLRLQRNQHIEEGENTQTNARNDDGVHHCASLS